MQAGDSNSRLSPVKDFPCEIRRSRHTDDAKPIAFELPFMLFNLLFDLFTAFEGAREVVTDLREVVFKGQALYQLIPNVNGEAKTLTWSAMT